MDNTTKAIVAETGVGGTLGGCCGPLFACAECGIKVVVTCGAAYGAIVLCGACYAGSKFKDLPTVGKGAVAVSSAAVGAFSGVCVVDAVATGACLVASPAMIAGAAVGVVIVGSAVAFGALAASLDRKNNDLEAQRQNNEARFQEIEARFQRMEALMSKKTAGSLMNNGMDKSMSFSFQ